MKFLNYAFLPTLMLAVACGGGGSSSGGGGGVNGSFSTISAQFIDAPVKGLNVEKNSGNTVTGDNGVFSCLEGESITFKLRNLTIGIGACGEKIFLDDVVTNTVQANKVAAVLLSLSSVDPSLGLIDLSLVPTNEDVDAEIDLSLAEGALLTDINDLKTAIGGGGFQATVASLAAARAHVNQQLEDNAPTGDLATALEDLSNGAGIDLRATLTSGSVENCWRYIDATMDVVEDVSLAGVYRNTFNNSSIIAYDDTAYASCDAQAETDEECERGSDIIEDLSRVITSTKLAFGSSSSYAFSINDATSNTENIRSVETRQGVDQTPFLFTFDDGNVTALPIEAVAGNFPFTMESSTKITIDFSNYPTSVSGVMEEKGFNLYLSDYTTSTNYVMEKDTYTCNYKITKR